MKKVIFFLAFVFSLNILYANHMDAEFTPTEISNNQVESSEKIATLFVPNSYVQVDCGFNTGTGYEPYRFFYGAQFMMDGGNFSSYFGARAGLHYFGFTSSLVAWPLKLTHVRFGLGALYHLDFYWDVSMTNSIMPGIYFQLKTGGVFGLTVNVNYLGMFRTIYSLVETKPALLNHSMGVNLVADFNLPGNFGLSFAFGSYETFRVMVLGTPCLTLDFHYTLNNSWQFGLTVVNRFIDFFTLSAFWYDADFQVRVRYLF